MKIAVVGSGLIGYVISNYLCAGGNEIECISPSIDTYENEVAKSKEDIIKYKGPVSPKFLRKDFQKSKYVSDYLLKKECNDFSGIEIIDDIGLARYWGANLAVKGLKEDIDALKLSEQEYKYLNSILPQLDVLNFYNKIYPKYKINNINKFMNKINAFESTKIHSSILAIWESKIDKDNLPDERKNKAIFGSDFNVDKQYKKIKGYVEKVIFSKDDESKHSLMINNGKGVTKHKYDFIIIACGALGSYRLITNSLQNNNIKKHFVRLLHHPTLVSLSFVPKIKYPNEYISMSNFDVFMKSEYGNLYINFFPFKGALKAIYREKLKASHIKYIKRKISFLINRMPDIPIFPGWWLNRLYVSNIYVPANFTASYISNNNGCINIIGAYRFDFDKVIMKRAWSFIKKQLLKQKIYTIVNRPKLVQKGGDMHYSSSLINYTDINGNLFYRNKKYKNILIVDSSSSRKLPSPNPSYFFIARAIKLVRNLKSIT